MPLAELAERLRSLHRQDRPLVLANIWDPPTARLVEGLGFPAVATTSAGMAETLGGHDGELIPPSRMLDAVSRIAASVSVPVTADLESGYGIPPKILGERVLEAGAVGLNLEDTDHHGEGVLIDAQIQAERISEIKAASRERGAELVLNARVDVFIREVGPPESRLEEALARGRLYAEAGADCIYPIGVVDEDVIRTLVESLDTPVNVLARPDGPPLSRLAELGVARVSLGPFLHRVAMRGVEWAAGPLVRGDDAALRRALS